MLLQLLSCVTCSPGQAFGEDSEESSSSEQETESGGDRESNGNDGALHDTTSQGTRLPASPADQDNSGKDAGAGATANGSRKKREEAHDKQNGGNDDEYLDGIISELALKAAAAAAKGGACAKDLQTGASSPLALLLRCDPRCLKLDQELRRKFGGSDRVNGAAAGAGGRGGGGRARRPRRGMMVARGGNSSASASLTLKRLIVSAPKEDWPKPPSFVGGGLGMKKCEAGAPSYLPRWQLEAHCGAEWFVFERSSSLEQLQVRSDKSG